MKWPVKLKLSVKQPMKPHWLFIFSLFPLIFAGCTKSHNGKLQFDDELHARRIFSQSVVDCPTGDCPGFVGGLYNISLNKTTKQYDVSACSASLIGPDQILTNAHCVPEDISRIGDLCQGHIRVVFPKTDTHPLETFACQKILNISPVPENPENPDWVILKLDRVSVREPLAFDHSGIQTMEPVTLYKINFKFNDLSPARGTVIKTHCLINTHHAQATHFIGSVSALFNISDCTEKLIVGNSGSAVINKEGKLIGLFSFIAPLLTNLPHHFNQERDVGGGTNGACIPFGNHKIPESCKFDETEYHSLAIRYAYWLRLQWDPQDYKILLDTHRKNILQHSSKIRFTFFERLNYTPDFSFNIIKEPMAALKSDFVNQALPYFMNSFPECVHQGIASSFQVVLGTWVPDYFDNTSLMGQKDEHNSIYVESKTGEQTFLFEKKHNYDILCPTGGGTCHLEEKKDHHYKVTMIETETSSLSDLLGLDPDHELHFYVPICNRQDRPPSHRRL